MKSTTPSTERGRFYSSLVGRRHTNQYTYRYWNSLNYMYTYRYWNSLNYTYRYWNSLNYMYMYTYRYWNSLKPQPSTPLSL